MNRRSKKDIKAVVDGLKEKKASSEPPEIRDMGKPTDKKSSMRIRKKGV